MVITGKLLRGGGEEEGWGDEMSAFQLMGCKFFSLTGW